MNIEIKERPEEIIISRKIKFTIFFYMFTSFLVLSGLFFERMLDEPYKYLLASPSFFNYPALSWVSSAWGSVLGIHGTIAALSITFMSMFVSQISTSSEYGFESLTKKLLLRKFDFLFFSIQSICSLLCGVFLFMVGSGLLGYFISSCFSIYFIFRYGFMYYKLYSIIEKPEVIKEILFDEIRRIKEMHDATSVLRLNIEREFAKIKSACKLFDIDARTIPWDRESITLKVFPDKPDAVVSGFDPKIFDLLSREVSTFGLDAPPIISFNFSFLQSLSFASIEMTSGTDVELNEGQVSAIEAILVKCFFYTVAPSVNTEFKAFEEALVNNIRSSLLNGDERSIDFGVKVFHGLISSDNYLFTLKNIDFALSSSNKRDVLETAVLTTFFEKMTTESLNENNFEMTSNIMRGILGLARFIYSKSNFYDFYKGIFNQFDYRVRYKNEESNYAFLDLYLNCVLDNLVDGNSKAFELDTDFITSKLLYLDLDARCGHDLLNEFQKKVLRCLFEVITLLIMRVEHVKKRVNDGRAELENLMGLLKSWVNAKFLDEIYYKSGVYDLLFSIPERFTVFGAEEKIREIPEGEARWVTISNDTYKMIVLMLTQNTFNCNKFDLQFASDEFASTISISTHQLKSILSYTESNSFDEILDLTSGNGKNNKEKLISDLKLIISSVNNVILKRVIDSDLDVGLVSEYIQKIKLSAHNYFDLILPLDKVAYENGIYGRQSNLLISKREVIPSIDKVHYEMNTENNGRGLIYEWIRYALDCIENHNLRIVSIDSLQDLNSEKLITIEYMVQDYKNTFRYAKGVKIGDKEGRLKLGGAGMYYLDLDENFFLKRNDELLTANIVNISPDNLREIKKLFVFGDENPFLYSVLNVVFNIILEPKNNCVLYFLSEEKCQLMNDVQHREINQLLQGGRLVNADNDIF